MILDYLKDHWVDILISIVIVLISVLLTKACDRIMPDQPVVIEKIPDTIQVVHVHNSFFDSLSVINGETESVVENRLRNQIGNRSNKNQSHNIKLNKVLLSAGFPNAKGYFVKSAAPYFFS